MSLENRVIAVTGAGKGLGRAYALYLASQGARIVVNNRAHAGEALSSAQAVVDEITAAGGSAVADHSSVENPDAGIALLECALGNFGRIDGLIANAGIMENRTFQKQTLDSLKHVLDINLMGTINVVHPVFRHMCDNGGGSIIVSTSSAGLFGEFGLPAYSASKAAVIGLMRSLALEGKRKAIKVNAIAPYASTQMTSAFISEKMNARLTADRVAPVIGWLLQSDVSGETIIAGGGRAARAAMRTTAPTVMPAFDEAEWDALQNAKVDSSFDGANAHFVRFAGVDE